MSALLLLSSLPAGATSALGVLLAIDPVPEEDDVRPGQVYAWIIIGLIVVLVLLWFSLKRHLGRINLDGDGEPAPRDREGQDT